jgi:hypothetical protein
MNPFRRGREGRNVALVGWLFADLLLALAMIFLVANATAKVTAIAPTPTPAPTAIPTATPTPMPPPSINPKDLDWKFTISDPYGFATDTTVQQTFVTQLKAELVSAHEDSSLAGFALISSGGTIDLARALVAFLPHSGVSSFTPKTVFRTFFVTGGDPTHAEMDVFFFQ